MTTKKESIGITELSALTQWVNTVTKGVYTVEFIDGAETAAISGDRMMLPTPNTAMTLRDMIRLRGFALHETSHPLYQADAFKVLEEFPMDPESPLRAVYNMMLDVHAETSRAEEYPGDKKALSEFGAVLGRDVSDSLLSKVGTADEASRKLLALMHRTLEAESQWNLGLRSGTNELREAMPDESKAISEDIEEKFDLNYRLTDPTETGRSLWELARNVYEYVWKKPADEEKKEMQVEAQGKGQGGEGEEGEKQEGAGQSPDGDGKFDKDAPKGEKAEPGKGKIKVTEMVWSSHYEGEEGGDYGHGKAMDFSDYTSHAQYTPYPQNKFEVIDYDSGKRKPKHHGYRTLPHFDPNNSPGFVSELRRLIQVEAQSQFVQGFRSGKLSASRLWRIGAPPIDEGRWNATVFKRKTETSSIMDTCVTLLIDASGSMGGRKYEQAYKAAQMLNDTLTRILKIPVEVLTFTSNGDQPVMGIIKRFDRQVNAGDMHIRFSDFISEMSGNNDADSIAWTYTRLKQRKEKRKILVVFSDGSPADGNGDPYYALKTVVSEIESQGIVDVYGIGICSNAVDHFYTQRDVIEDANDVQRALIAVLRKAMRK